VENPTINIVYHTHTALSSHIITYIPLDHPHQKWYCQKSSKSCWSWTAFGLFAQWSSKQQLAVHPLKLSSLKIQMFITQVCKTPHFTGIFCKHAKIHKKFTTTYSNLISHAPIPMLY